MAIDYNRMRQTAIRLITENGRDVIVRERDSSAHNPVTGEVTTSYADTDSMAVFTSTTSENITDLEIKTGDKICFVLDEVKIADMIVDSYQDENWQVVWVDEKFPGPIKIVWKCVVRK